jgi:putative intracellular protease/amidase/YHS domain-containing protein
MKTSFVILGLLLFLFGCPAIDARPDEAQPVSDEVLVLKGLDPVALVRGQEVPGDPKLAERRGRFLYRFATPENRSKFQAKPEDFEVQLQGQCVAMPGAVGDPELFTVYQGKIYLGGSPGCLEHFQSAPARYLKLHADRKKVAILVFEGVQIIDFTGPYEVFGEAGFDVFTVAERRRPLKTNMRMTIIPTYSFTDCPRPDIIVVPGGSVSPNLRPAILRWIKECSDQASNVLSVCNGAFFLAKAGMLDGLSATTVQGGLETLQQRAPKSRVVSDQRFVDNGKIITSAGLSSGIDGALHVVEKLYGRGEAQQVALGMEYNWQPEAGFARAKLADVHLNRALGRSFGLPEGTVVKVHSTHGDTDHWQKVWEIHPDGSVSDVLHVVEKKLEQTWSKTAPNGSRATSASHWKFTDKQGKTWNAICKLDPMPNASGAYLLCIQIDRATSVSGD